MYTVAPRISKVIYKMLIQTVDGHGSRNTQDSICSSVLSMQMRISEEPPPQYFEDIRTLVTGHTGIYYNHMNNAKEHKKYLEPNITRLRKKLKNYLQY